MFRFKMHTKVLVVILFFGQVIELNVNLCIALSFERDQPINRIKLHRQEWNWPRQVASDWASSVEGSVAAPERFNSLLLASGFDAGNGFESLVEGQTSISGGADVGSARRAARSPQWEPATGGLLSQSLESTGSYEYFGQIGVGNPQQKLYVLFDTSSSVFWLTSSECKSGICIGRSKFNGSESRTYKLEEDKQPLKLSYDDNDIRVNARLVRDSVSIAGLTLENHLFGEALELDGQALSRMPVDGIIGLGLGPGFATSDQASLNDSSKTTCEADGCLSQERISERFVNILSRMQQQGLLKEPIYSLYLNNENENRHMYNTHNGELIFGEIVYDYFEGELTYTPVTRPDFWEFQLSKVSLKQNIYASPLESGCDSACPAIIDSGSRYIGGHFADIDRLNRQIGAVPKADGFYTVTPCYMRMLPNLVFEIGGQEFSLTPEDYVQQVKIKGVTVECVSALRVINAERYPFWVLGEMFLKRHYIVFDFGRKRIGFAPSKRIGPEEVEAKLKKNPYYFGRRTLD